jgi:peroxin-5
MLTFHQVVRLFNEAAQMSPEDADVHIVLGVLYNLSREYDKAIASFKTALQLKPQDYSLWNKLGATQANSIQSADAILAYQKVISSNTYLNFQFGLFPSRQPRFIYMLV